MKKYKIIVCDCNFFEGSNSLKSNKKLFVNVFWLLLSVLNKICFILYEKM